MSDRGFGHHRRQRNWGARMREFTWLGMRALALENELLRIGILVDKGSDVFEFLYKPLDLDFVWLTASGFRNPADVAGVTSTDPQGSFLDTYGGGWQEILPSGGARSEHAGATYGQHGEISVLPWDYEIVEDAEKAVAVRLSVSCVRAPLRLRKDVRLEAGSGRVEVVETLSNESDVPVRLMWGHHLAFGPPFLAPGATIQLPAGIEGIPHPSASGDSTRRIRSDRFPWPSSPAPDGDTVDLSILPEPGTASDIVYLTGFGDVGRYEVASKRAALRVEWDALVMPYLWFWQEFGQTTGYPWYGRNWNVGLEPFSSYPTNGLAEAVENGSALELAPGAEQPFSMLAEVIVHR